MTAIQSEIIKNIKYEIQPTKSGRKLIWIADDWESSEFRGFLNSLRENPQHGSVLSKFRNLLVRVGANPEHGLKQDLLVKEFRLYKRYDRLRFFLIRSKAVRSLEVSLALDSLKIKVPKPVAVVEERGKFNSLLYSFFITEYVDYDYDLKELLREDHPLRDQVARLLPSLAQDIKRMHQAGIIHNDLHAGNILIKNLNHQPELYFIDLNRAQFKQNPSPTLKLRDLGRFVFTGEEQAIFLRNYSPSNFEELFPRMLRERNFRQTLLNSKRKVRAHVRALLGIKKKN